MPEDEKNKSKNVYAKVFFAAYKTISLLVRAMKNANDGQRKKSWITIWYLRT